MTNNDIQVSQDKIKEFVSKMLQDKNINIRYLPDSIEERIYTNVLTILLSLMENVIEDISIKLIGHEVRITLQPHKDKTEEISTQTDQDEQKES
jgi:hypothetical protein